MRREVSLAIFIYKTGDNRTRMIYDFLPLIIKYAHLIFYNNNNNNNIYLYILCLYECVRDNNNKKISRECRQRRLLLICSFE